MVSTLPKGGDIISVWASYPALMSACGGTDVHAVYAYSVYILDRKREQKPEIDFFQK